MFEPVNPKELGPPDPQPRRAIRRANPTDPLTRNSFLFIFPQSFFINLHRASFILQTPQVLLRRIHKA